MLVNVTHSCLYEFYKENKANSADLDQRLWNAATDQGLCFCFEYRKFV